MNVHEIEAKSILTPATGYIGAYDYVLNPYQGCQFGCSYCYVPMFVYFRRLASSWGKEIFVKINAPHLLRREAVKSKLAGMRIFISPSTDPYNPVERSYQITRQCLEVLVEYPPAVVMIQTRSPLVTRDCDLFQELRERGVQVVVGVTLSTDREEVRKIFEPQCASIPRRLATLTDLHARGFLTQASLSPLLPCNPSVLAEMVAPYCDWMTVQPLHALGGGARTWTPAIELVKMHGWEDWLEGGPAVADAMASLQAFFGPSRFHVAEEGFSLGWLK